MAARLSVSCSEPTDLRGLMLFPWQYVCVCVTIDRVLRYEEFVISATGYIFRALELGTEDVSLLVKCAHFRGTCLQVPPPLKPVNTTL